MADYPTTGFLPPVISCFSKYSACSSLLLYANSASNGSSGTWPSANRGLFIPFSLPSSYTVASLWCVNGTTATGNIDMGLFTTDGGMIVSKGLTAQSGTSTLQILTVGPIIIPPGNYFLGISSSSASTTFISRTPNVQILQRFGVMQAASQSPLATSPTFATCASAFLPHCGIASITTF